MVDTNLTFGFEILQTLYDSQLTKKEDVLILFVHWYLLKNGFRCIGLGDSKAYNASEKGSELLAEGWNTRPNYAIRYVNDGKLYIFHGIKSDEDLLLNMLKVDDQSVSNVRFPINQTVTDLRGPLETIIPSHQTVLQSLQNDFINPVLPSNTTENSTQTSATERNVRTEPDPDPLSVGRSSHPLPHPWNTDPSRVGAADLDPFGRGGGMIFDPFSPAARNPIDPRRPALGVPGRLPPGAVPPFARFDPFGPPDNNPPRPRPNPDSDDVLPPGYDDMFM
ncbi:proteasome inhibitor 31 kDa [Calliopsis andreniformis]|uniref:proteasome inhibitor 31 kDa n=1 Tax=Calliopsis andreniformis TaxID=337506 RepID=UPI003FCC9D2C